MPRRPELWRRPGGAALIGVNARGAAERPFGTKSLPGLRRSLRARHEADELALGGGDVALPVPQHQEPALGQRTVDGDETSGGEGARNRHARYQRHAGAGLDGRPHRLVRRQNERDLYPGERDAALAQQRR